MPARISTATGRAAASNSSRCTIIGRRSSLVLSGLVGARFFADYAAQDVFEVFLFDRLLERFVDQGLVTAAPGARTEVLHHRHVEIHGQSRLAAWRRIANALRLLCRGVGPIPPVAARGAVCGMLAARFAGLFAHGVTVRIYMAIFKFIAARVAGAINRWT